jgi:hypothetical protein
VVWLLWPIIGCYQLYSRASNPVLVWMLWPLIGCYQLCGCAINPVVVWLWQWAQALAAFRFELSQFDAHRGIQRRLATRRAALQGPTLDLMRDTYGLTDGEMRALFRQVNQIAEYPHCPKCNGRLMASFDYRGSLVLQRPPTGDSKQQGGQVKGDSGDGGHDASGPVYGGGGAEDGSAGDGRQPSTTAPRRAEAKEGPTRGGPGSARFGFRLEDGGPMEQGVRDLGQPSADLPPLAEAPAEHSDQQGRDRARDRDDRPAIEHSEYQGPPVPMDQLVMMQDPDGLLSALAPSGESHSGGRHRRRQRRDDPPAPRHGSDRPFPSAAPPRPAEVARGSSGNGARNRGRERESPGSGPGGGGRGGGRGSGPRHANGGGAGRHPAADRSSRDQRQDGSRSRSWMPKSGDGGGGPRNAPS